MERENIRETRQATSDNLDSAVIEDRLYAGDPEACLTVRPISASRRRYAGMESRIPYKTNPTIRMGRDLGTH
jgi:hypothetical protein